jgi:PleD family two-component response regulator
VIHVGVREQDVTHGDVFLSDELEETVHFVAGIDHDPFARARTRDDEAVLEERADGLRLDYDHVVILAILDDLLFTSKIRSAATQAGVPVTFARGAAAALDQMRASAPSLVILDLNNPRTDPLGTLAAMRADPALAAIPTVGFVSHVDTTTIDAAREAGISEVLARSAFATRLPEILGRGRPSAPPVP